MGSDVPAFLQAIQLQTFADNFEEHGYDSVADIRELDSDGFAELVDVVGLKTGHVAKLKRALYPTAPQPAADPAAAASPDAAAHAGPSPPSQGAAPAVAPQQPAPPPPPPPATCLQQEYASLLFERDILGQLKHGNLHECYAHNGSPSIVVTSMKTSASAATSAAQTSGRRTACMTKVTTTATPTTTSATRHTSRSFARW